MTSPNAILVVRCIISRFQKLIHVRKGTLLQGFQSKEFVVLVNLNSLVILVGCGSLVVYWEGE